MDAFHNYYDNIAEEHVMDLLNNLYIHNSGGAVKTVQSSFSIDRFAAARRAFVDEEMNRCTSYLYFSDPRE